MKCFRFIVAEEANHAVAIMCRVLRVARSGYYAWRGRQPEQGGVPSARARADGELTQRIHQIHTKSRGTYGSPRVHAELGDDGVHCGRKRVARLMRQAGLAGCHRRARRPRTTTTDRQATLAPDRVERAFAPEQIGAPNTLWVADVTYVPTDEGWLYLAAVLDAFSRHCSGWAMADHLRTELVLDAVELAIARRRPAKDGGLVHHSDHGCQGAFNWLSQHHDEGELRWQRQRKTGKAAGQIMRGGRRCALLAGRRWPDGRPGSSSGRQSRAD